MSELEDALTRASSDVHKAYYSASLHHETDQKHIPITDDEACPGCGYHLEQFDAALARLERLVRLEALDEVLGDDALESSEDVCARLFQLHSEIAEAVK